MVFIFLYSCIFQNTFQLTYSHHRNKPEEEQQPEQEYAQRPYKQGLIINCRVIGGPARRKEGFRQPSDHDHITFKPHPDINNDRHDEYDGQVLPDFLEPEKLWYKCVAG